MDNSCVEIISPCPRLAAYQSRARTTESSHRYPCSPVTSWAESWETAGLVLRAAGSQEPGSGQDHWHPLAGGWDWVRWTPAHLRHLGRDKLWAVLCSLHTLTSAASTAAFRADCSGDITVTMVWRYLPWDLCEICEVWAVLNSDPITSESDGEKFT